MVTFKMIVVGVLMLSTIGVLPIPINISSVSTDSTGLLADDHDTISAKTTTDFLTVKDSPKNITDSTITKVLTPTPTRNSTATSNRTSTEQHPIPGLEEPYSALDKRTLNVPTVSLANHDGFMTSAYCITVPVLSNPIVNTATTKAFQDRTCSPVCIRSPVNVSNATAQPLQQHTSSVVPTRLLVILNAATTEPLQERTFIPICTGSLANFESNTAITEPHQQDTYNVVSPESLVILTATTTEQLQERATIPLHTGSLASVTTVSTESLQRHVPNAIPTGKLASVNIATTVPIRQHTSNVVPTRSLVNLSTATAKPHQEYSLIPICKGSIVRVDTATTVSRQQHNSNVVITVSLVILDVATTQPLQHGKLDLSPIVSLANRDITISSRETSLIDLKDENRSPPDSRSPLHGRITYASVAFIATFIISGMMVTRLGTLRLSEWRSLTIINFLTTLIYTLAILFIYTAGMLMDGWDLTSESLCRGAIYLCLIFYIGCKAIMYVFLVERAHMLRHVPRRKDVVFLVGMAVLVFGFGPIVIVAFKEPIIGRSAVDGMCQIGFPITVTIPMLAHDIIINTLMVGMYVFLAWPYMGGRGSPGVWLRALGLNTNTGGLSQRLILEILICKGIYGACLVVLPTVANVAVLYKVHGREQGWLCFTICTIDLSWSVVIIHWLTAKPRGLEEAPSGTYLEMG